MQNVWTSVTLVSNHSSQTRGKKLEQGTVLKKQLKLVLWRCGSEVKGQPAAVKTVTPLTSVHQHLFVHVSLCLHLLLQYYLKHGSLSLCWNPNPTVAFFNFSTIKTTTRSLKTPGLDRGLNPRPGPQPQRLLDWSAL